MKYTIRINLEQYEVAPELWPTIKDMKFEKAAGVAKPWIDAGYFVEFTAIPGEDEDEEEDDEYENEYEDIAAPYVPLVCKCIDILQHSGKEVGNGD